MLTGIYENTDFNMDFYKLFDIPATPLADKTVVKKKYFELSRLYHPDFAINTDESSVESNLAISSSINKAYKVFTSPSLTLQYFLQYKSAITEDEKYPLPSDFLMDMMDINEMLEEAKTTNNNTLIGEVTENIKATEDFLYHEVKEIIACKNEEEIDDKSMEMLKAYYYKKKYIQRILDGIS